MSGQPTRRLRLLPLETSSSEIDRRSASTNPPGQTVRGFAGQGSKLTLVAAAATVRASRTGP